MWKSVHPVLTTVALLCVGGLTTAFSVEAADDGAALSLPSEPGQTVARIRNMPAGSWLDLGVPAPDPRRGFARGRAWTSKMAFSAALGGAFLFGEGIHGWSDGKTGRYMDGLWLYDVNAHRWVNLYAGTDTRSPPKLVITKDGFEGVAEDRPIPIATMVHGYEMTAWDPQRQIFFAMPNGHSYYARALPTVHRFRKTHGDRLNGNAASPWMFDPWNRRWHRLRTPARSPASTYGNVLMYVPSRQALFFHGKKTVAYYLPEKNVWQYPAISGPPPPFGIDPTACHDAKRDRIYIGGGNYPIAKGENALWIFDVRNNRWQDPKPAGSPGGNHFGTNVAVMTCDTQKDRVLLFRHGGPAHQLHIYDAGTNRWQDRPVPLPREWHARRVVNGFYHPGLGAHFLHVSRDSRPDGRIFVYKPE